MKIDGNSPIPPPLGGRADRAEGRTPAPTRTSGPGTGREDSLEVSPAAREFQAIRGAAIRAPEARAELIGNLKDRIAAGAYEPSDRVVAERMLEELGDGLSV